MFYVLVLLVVGLLKGTPRRIFLLIASYYFYCCWNWHYIWVILLLTLIDYFAGLQIEKSTTINIRRLYLWLSLTANIGLLGTFKYFNFLSASTAAGFHALGLQVTPPLLKVILPVGISFHTFQAMSYTIDVYQRKVPAERSLLNYALYVAFFPQMVAGPIERPRQLLPQFHRDPHVTVERVHSGLQVALWGLFKKMVIADSIGGVVDLVYRDPRQFTNTEVLVATLLFSIQIYCDFSGYSDMAVGVARVMGYELRINFSQPYLSKSVGEFWHRWHISLSTWFRDYVYIPLGGNRVRLPRYLLNLMITFVVSGLWHGASVVFIVWGALHGLYMVVSRLTMGLRARAVRTIRLDTVPRIHAVLQSVFTFLLVTIAWVFFRSPTIGEAMYVVRHLIPGGNFRSGVLVSGGLPQVNAAVAACCIGSMFVVEWFALHPHRLPAIWRRIEFRYAAYYLLVIAIVMFGVFGQREFIYFQF